MSLKEKAAYLKGLSEGLGLDTESREGKLLSVVIDMLSDMAVEIEDLNENALDIGEELDAISSDLADVEEFLFDNDDDDDDDFDDFLDFDDDDDDDFDDDEDDDDDCDCEYCDKNSFSYEVDCPSCGEKIELTESDLMNATVKCSSCGEELEFEFDGPDDDDDDDDYDDDDDDEDDTSAKD